MSYVKKDLFFTTKQNQSIPDISRHNQKARDEYNQEKMLNLGYYWVSNSLLIEQVLR